MYNGGRRSQSHPFLNLCHMNASFFKGKRILVTGATGTIGSAIVRQLLPCKPGVVRLFSRDEHKHFLLQQEWGQRPDVRFLIGDVRDKSRLTRAMENIDFVFHCAAYKHIHLSEYNSFEVVQTNVIGTQNVIEAAMTNDVERVLLISTDKATSPSSVMGASKLLAEKLMTSAMHSVGPRRLRLASVRFGNVIGSRGSVIPTFCQQIRHGGPLTITDPDMTRFFMSITDAVNLTFGAMEQMQGGEVFILKMPALKLGDLVAVLIEELAPTFGRDPAQIKCQIVGKRPGEKMQEVLMTEEEALAATESEDMFIVHSVLRLPGEDTLAPPPATAKSKIYNSAEVPLLSKAAIRVLVRDYIQQLGPAESLS